MRSRRYKAENFKGWPCPMMPALIQLETGQTLPVQALIDSAADYSTVPGRMFTDSKIDVEWETRTIVSRYGHSGETRAVPGHLWVGGAQVSSPLRVTAPDHPMEHSVLGLDFLALHEATFMWDEESPSFELRPVPPGIPFADKRAPIEEVREAPSPLGAIPKGSSLRCTATRIPDEPSPMAWLPITVEMRNLRVPGTVLTGTSLGKVDTGSALSAIPVDIFDDGAGLERWIWQNAQPWGQADGWGMVTEMRSVPGVLRVGDCVVREELLLLAPGSHRQISLGLGDFFKAFRVRFLWHLDPPQFELTRRPS